MTKSAEDERYKWWALSCTSLGVLLVATNSGTLIIALPELERALGTSLLELVWVILAYMISSTVLVLTAGISLLRPRAATETAMVQRVAGEIDPQRVAPAEVGGVEAQRVAGEIDPQRVAPAEVGGVEAAEEAIREEIEATP